MKTSKTTVLAFFMLLLMNFSFAQDKQPTMFSVHTDNVKFDKMKQYEEAAKEMKDNCVKYNVKGASWTAISVEDGRYVYVTPIDNMADLDKNPMGDLFEKMDANAASAMFKKMDECYDSHSDMVVHYNQELSYNPASADSSDSKNYLEYHFLYYTPKNAKAINEALKKVKTMFESKGITNAYNVYHSGFGSKENYYMISISGKDGMEIEKNGETNDKAFGEEGKATFFNVISLTNRYDRVSARLRPDLSYQPTKK